MPTLPARRPDLIVRVIADETVVLDPLTDSAHALNPLAAAVFDRCDGRSSLAAVAADLDVDVSEVVAALGALDGLGLVAAGGGMSRRRALQSAVVVGGGLVATPLISSIVAPTAAAAVSLHAGSGSGGTGAKASFTLNSYFNNNGVEDNYSDGNYDFESTSYPAEYPGFPAAGSTVSFDGYDFTFPSTANSGTPDNISAATGQTILLSGAVIGATGLGFLGSSTDGTRGGPVTITYTTGAPDTSQSLTFGDWAYPAPSTGGVVFTTTYRNASYGQASVPTNLLEQSLTLDSSRVVQSVTLPTDAKFHVFAISTK